MTRNDFIHVTIMSSTEVPKGTQILYPLSGIKKIQLTVQGGLCIWFPGDSVPYAAEKSLLGATQIVGLIDADDVKRLKKMFREVPED
jgi:hypothetical protein